MKRKLLFSLIPVTLVATFVLAAPAQSRREAEVFELVNQQRMKAGLNALAWDDRVGGIAREYSRQMARENFFDHYDPEGHDVMDRADRAKLTGWVKIGENLFACSPTPDFSRKAVVGWMGSETHRVNILDREWTSTGIGVATARDGSIYVTQVFTRDSGAGK
jgi:uncharacterized protein YkwD